MSTRSSVSTKTKKSGAARQASTPVSVVPPTSSSDSEGDREAEEQLKRKEAELEKQRMELAAAKERKKTERAERKRREAEEAEKKRLEEEAQKARAEEAKRRKVGETREGTEERTTAGASSQKRKRGPEAGLPVAEEP